MTERAARGWPVLVAHSGHGVLAAGSHGGRRPRPGLPDLFGLGGASVNCVRPIKVLGWKWVAESYSAGNWEQNSNCSHLSVLLHLALG